MTTAIDQIKKLTEALDHVTHILHCVVKQYGDGESITIDNKYGDDLRQPHPFKLHLEQNAEHIKITPVMATPKQIREAQRELKSIPDYYHIKPKLNGVMRKMFNALVGS